MDASLIYISAGDWITYIRIWSTKQHIIENGNKNPLKIQKYPYKGSEYDFIKELTAILNTNYPEALKIDKTITDFIGFNLDIENPGMRENIL